MFVAYLAGWRMSPRDIERIYEAAIQLFKSKDYRGYGAELQPTICTILAFVDEYERQTGQKLQFALNERAIPQPIDQE